jgi:hypothetical protein
MNSKKSAESSPCWRTAVGTDQQLLLVQYSCYHNVINPQFLRSLFIRMLQYLHCEWGNLLKAKVNVTLEQAMKA